MTVESATYLDTLDPSLPLSGDPKSEGDNHLRLIKQVLKNTFPNINAAVTPTDEQLNQLLANMATPNLVLNPHGSIQQESTALQTTTGAYFADQWAHHGAGTGFAWQQGAQTGTVSAFDPLHMFTNTTTAKASLAAGDKLAKIQPIEGRNLRRLLYGGASARSSWLRFRASSTQAGTASVAIRNAALARSWVQSFAVTTTPTDYSFLVPGDTTGTWQTGDVAGAYLTFCHAAGTTHQTATLGSWQAGDFVAANTQSNMLDTVNRQLNISDVSWKPGSILLPFTEIDFEKELTRVQRYFIAFACIGANAAFGTGQAFATTDAWIPVPLPTTMRIPPNISVSAAGDFRLLSAGGASIAVTGTGTVATTTNMLNMSAAVAGGLTGGHAAVLHSANANARILATARM